MGNKKLKFQEGDQEATPKQSPLPGGPEQPKMEDTFQPKTGIQIFPECFKGVNFDGVGLVEPPALKNNKPYVKFKIISAQSVLANANSAAGNTVAKIFGPIYGTKQTDLGRAGTGGASGSTYAGKLDEWQGKLCQKLYPSIRTEACGSVITEDQVYQIYYAFLLDQVSKISQTFEGECSDCTPAGCSPLSSLAAAIQTAVDTTIETMNSFVGGANAAKPIDYAELVKANQWLNELQRHAYYASKAPDGVPEAGERIGCETLSAADTWAEAVVADCKKNPPTKNCEVLNPLAARIKALTDPILEKFAADSRVCVSGFSSEKKPWSIQNFSLPKKECKDNSLICFAKPQTRTIKGMELMTCGEKEGKGVNFTKEDFQGMINAFKELKDEVTPPLKLTHEDLFKPGVSEYSMDEALPAFGWLTNVYLDEGNGCKLLGDFENVPVAVHDLIPVAFRRNSLEVYRNYDSPTTGKKYPMIIVGNALLGSDLPAVPELAPLEKVLSKQATFEDLQAVYHCCSKKEIEGKVVSATHTFSFAQPAAATVSNYAPSAPKPEGPSGIQLLQARLKTKRDAQANDVSRELTTLALEEHQSHVERWINEGKLSKSLKDAALERLAELDSRVPNKRVDYQKLVTFCQSLDPVISFTR